MKNNKGFILAELLIVAAIIAVLAAISIPIFTKQLERARESTDIANMRNAYALISVSVLTEDDIGGTGGENDTGDGNKGDTSEDNINDIIKNNAKEYPDIPEDGQSISIEESEIYIKDGNVYIVTTNKEFNKYYYEYPGESNSQYLFIQPNGIVLTDNDKNESGAFINVKSGSLYIDSVNTFISVQPHKTEEAADCVILSSSDLTI